jgi:hypothetical protein
MWRTIAGSIAIAGLMTSCLPATPSSDRLAASIVLTKHAPGVNFGTYQTFYIRPEIRELKDEGEIEPLPDSVAGPLLDEMRDQLKKRGFEEAASKEEADLAVDMVYINTQWVATSCYSWWDGGYWGYPGYPYYPYYGGCSSATWQTHTLGTTIVDLTVAKSSRSGSISSALVDGGVADAGGMGGSPGAGGSSDTGGSSGESGSSGAGGSTGGNPGGGGSSSSGDGGNVSIRLGGIWFSGIYGVVFDTATSAQQAFDGIGQAFEQSPYLTNEQ